MRMKSIFFLAVLFIVVLAAAPMTVMAETEAEQARVGDLLPAYEGYRWGVLGFVDYGHDLWITSIEMKEDETLYNLEGAVHDLSGGEADADFSIRMEYRVTSEVLLQVKDEETMMDSKFDRIELIRAPLEEGHSWTQEVTDPDGTERMLECTIAEVSGRPGSRVYTVRYEDPDSDYYEEREIGEGAGVLSFERFMSGEEEDYTVHYDLFEDNTGVELDLDFTDVEAGDWYAETVSRMTVMDILTGYPDGTFRPGQDISVAEFITVAVETLGFEGDEASEAWYQPYMDEATRLDLIEQGDFDQTDRPITREEMIRVIVRALDLPITDSEDSVFDDEEDIDPDLTAYVRTAYHKGLISGYPDGTFGPQRSTTRAEAAVLLTRMAERLGNQVPLETEDVLYLEEELEERIFHETGDDWVVIDFDSKEEVVDHLSAVTTRSFAWEQVENYYEIRDGELVLVPRDGPVMLIEDEPYRLERVHPLQTRLVQETETDMIGEYTMEITYRMGDGQWLMDNRDVTVIE